MTGRAGALQLSPRAPAHFFAAMPASKNSTTPLALWLGLALVVILLDQFTKVLVMGDFRLHDSRTVTSFFNLVRAHNTGAAFSFLADAAGWQRWFFVGLGGVASIFIVWMLKSLGLMPAGTLPSASVLSVKAPV